MASEALRCQPDQSSRELSLSPGGSRDVSRGLGFRVRVERGGRELVAVGFGDSIGVNLSREASGILF